MWAEPNPWCVMFMRPGDTEYRIAVCSDFASACRYAASVHVQGSKLADLPHITRRSS
jgi:hypothetical protein